MEEERFFLSANASNSPGGPADAEAITDRIREDFPILQSHVGGHPLAYLDNAATTQKPLRVAEVLRRYYLEENANIHRGVHALSQRATDAYDRARARAAKFINAEKPAEVIFVRGATEGINLVAASFGRKHFKPGGNLVLTILEHHSNIVPWQLAGEAAGMELRVTPMDDRGVLDLEAFEALIDGNTCLAAVTHVSNAIGTVNPVKTMARTARDRGVPVLVDGAQAAPHLPVDVQDMDCDFYVFSGHKVYGPTGIGILYGKQKWLEAMPPYQGGGGMIRSVSFERTAYKTIPEKFEAGTPHIGGAIGLAAALEYVENLGLDNIARREKDLLEYAHQAVADIKGARVLGTAPEKTSVLSFAVEGVHPHDAGTFLDAEGIAIRAGHHCAQPLMRRLGVPATARASFSFYNTREEIDRLAAALRRMKRFFSP